MVAIVAVERGWGIGKDGGLLLRNPADMRRFRALTMGHAVILGRRTLESFPGGKPLAGRENLVLSRTLDRPPEGVRLFRDVESLLAYAPADSFVIGGGQVYRQLLPYCQEAQVTFVDASIPADVFFPDLDRDPAWVLADSQGPEQAPGGIPFYYRTYRRKEGQHGRGV